MKKTYIAGTYEMTIEDSGGTRFIFGYLKLSAMQARKIMVSMQFYGVRVVSINLLDT